MLAVSAFIQPQKGSREYNAIKKALELKPQVDYLGKARDRRYFLVEGSFGAERIVRRWRDRDGEEWVQCLSCRAGYPPTDRRSKLPEYEPTPCFHAASVLIHEAAEPEQEPNGNRIDHTRTRSSLGLKT
jgi:hypothetical protein